MFPLEHLLCRARASHIALPFVFFPTNFSRSAGFLSVASASSGLPLSLSPARPRSSHQVRRNFFQPRLGSKALVSDYRSESAEIFRGCLENNFYNDESLGVILPLEVAFAMCKFLKTFTLQNQIQVCYSLKYIIVYLVRKVV